MLDLHNYTSMQEIILVCLGGFIGALVKDAFADGAFELPYKKDGKIYLGFIGGGLIGIFVGLVFDGNFLSALVSGYMGTSLIATLVSSNRVTGTQRQADKNSSDIKKLEDTQ